MVSASARGVPFCGNLSTLPTWGRDSSGWEPLFGQSERPLFVQSQRTGFYGAEGVGLCLRPLQEAITLVCLEVGGPYRLVVPSLLPAQA